LVASARDPLPLARKTKQPPRADPGG